MVSYRSRGRIGWGMLVLVLMGATTPAMADTQKAAPDHEWFESILGVPKEANLVVSDTELQSLGCMIGATTTILGTIILSSTAIIATGGRNAATATEIAVPVLAAASMAGCVVGLSRLGARNGGWRR